MMNMKKMLALLLAVVMVLGMIPFGAMAEEAETVTHIETCLENCALEDCACECHAEPETPAEPKQEENPVTPLSLDDTTTEETPVVDATKTEETPVCTCTPVEGVHAAECALSAKTEETPVVDDTKTEETPVVDATKTVETPVCTCTPVEGVHAPECALSAKTEETPVVDDTKTEETPVCTCTPVEGMHAEGCALYVKPEEPVCTCTPVEGVHVEGCALYEEPETNNNIDAEALLNELLAITDGETLKSRLEALTDEENAAIAAIITPEQDAQLYNLVYPAEEEEEVEIYTPAADYTNVATFSETVPVYQPVSFFSRLRSASPFALSRSTATEGLHLSKTADANSDGGYDISLEVYTTGTISVSQEVTPCDIILVVDQSTSMEDSFSSSSYKYSEVYSLNKNTTYYAGQSKVSVTWCDDCNAWTNGCSGWITHRAGTPYTPLTSADDTTSGSVQFYTRERVAAMNRMEALQAAASSFVDSVAARGEDNRIAIVGFHDTYIAHTGSGEAAFWDASDRAANLKNIISGLDEDLEGATDHDDGLEYAENLFAANTATGRNRVVILFTDGEPEPMSSGDWSAETVHDAIESAYKLKNTYGAALYTISVAPNTSGTGTSPMDNYMRYLSSNYPNARYTGSTNITQGRNETETEYEGRIVQQITPGTQADISSGSFYLTASDVDALEVIFKQIANQTGGSSVSLGAETEIRDIVSTYFDMPENTSDVTVQTYDCLSYNEETGAVTWSTTPTTLNSAEVVTIDQTNSTVSVDGFDFNRNFVAEKGRVEGDVTATGDFHGRKLVITFTVEPKDAFWGGNNVPTNGAESGVYVTNDEGEESTVGTFVVPEVNVPIHIPDFNATNQNIYLNSATLPGASDLTDFVIPSGTDEWKIDYVNVSGPSIDQTISNTKDTKDITVSVTATPKYDGTGASGTANGKDGVTKSATNKANVFVWVPSLTYKDTVHDYMSDEPTYDTNNKVDEMTWAHGTDTYNAANMFEETAPAVDLSYAPVSGITDGKITSKDHVPVNVIAKIGTEDITPYVVFNHQNCVFEGCPYDGNEDVEFYLHVINVSADLKIIKTVTGTIDIDQPFVFVIQGAADNDLTKNIKLTVSIQGAGEVTIKDLPIGTYTVTEDTSWAWRFNPSYTNNPITLVADADNVVTISNTQKDDSWINDFSAVVKNTYGIAKN